MNALGKGTQNVSQKRGWLLGIGLLAATLFLLPSTTRASSVTYDISSGTFTDGVTIDSGSSFTFSQTGSTITLASANIDTSAGDFTCSGAVGNYCKLFMYSTSSGEAEYFNAPDGSGYVSIQWLQSNLTGFPQSLPLYLGSYIYFNGPPASAYYLQTPAPSAMNTPEPGTLALMLCGMAALFFVGVRRVHA